MYSPCAGLDFRSILPTPLVPFSSVLNQRRICNPKNFGATFQWSGIGKIHDRVDDIRLDSSLRKIHFAQQQIQNKETLPDQMPFPSACRMLTVFVLCTGMAHWVYTVIECLGFKMNILVSRCTVCLFCYSSSVPHQLVLSCSLPRICGGLE